MHDLSHSRWPSWQGCWGNLRWMCLLACDLGRASAGGKHGEDACAAPNIQHCSAPDQPRIALKRLLIRIHSHLHHTITTLSTHQSVSVLEGLISVLPAL